jgi:hypothetical protein
MTRMTRIAADGGAGTVAAHADFTWRNAWTVAPFLGFCWLGCILVALLGTGLFYVFLGAIVHYMGEPLTMGGWALVRTVWFVIAFSLFMVGAGLFLITLTVLTGTDLLYPHNRPSITVRYLFPVAMVLAQLFRVKRDVLRVSYIKVNNAMTIAQRKRIHARRLLVLLPHCLQVDVCNRKLTSAVTNCARCGRCPMAALLDMGERYGLHMEVVNGGTLARRKVQEYQPDGIVAVACERDLMLGIQDVYPIPVYGVVNDRPHGPCYNTDVDMKLVEEGVRFFRQAAAA